MQRMRFLTAILAALCAGACATAPGPTVTHSLRAAQVALKGADVRLEHDALEWNSLARAAMARCVAVEAPKRRACLGAIAQSPRAAELAAQLGEAYDAIAQDLEAARAVAAELEALHREAAQEAAAR